MKKPLFLFYRISVVCFLSTTVSVISPLSQARQADNLEHSTGSVAASTSPQDALDLAFNDVIANTSSYISPVLSGLDNIQRNDISQIFLGLQPASNASCLAFDVAFYADEFPEYVGTRLNHSSRAMHQAVVDIAGQQRGSGGVFGHS